MDKGDILVKKPSCKLNYVITEQAQMETAPNKSPLPSNTSFHKLAGFIGPVAPNIANEVYERIKTPSKLRQSPSNREIFRSDETKGFERITRKYTEENNLPW